MPNQESSNAAGQRVISSDTSARMRYLMRINAEEGTAKKADVAGYDVGGVTSTAEKVVRHHDRKSRRYDLYRCFPGGQAEVPRHNAVR